MSPSDDLKGKAPTPESGDRDATRYGSASRGATDAEGTRYTDASSKVNSTDSIPQPPNDPAATRYTDTSADPNATAYTPTAGALAAPGRLPRRFDGYELLEELGRGGMGVVYKARQLAPDRLVALKVIRSGELATEDDVRRFRQEADEAARLDHSHIVPVYEVGEHDGLHFFTMKLVEGGGLDKHLERYRNDPKAAARLLATAARAVHYAHQRQLLHRDLKPGNILLDAAGQPHVADFGLAKRLEGDAVATRSGAVVGTPEYMAPEQARGEKRLTTAADVYALGGVLYTLLTGQPAFRDPGGLVLVKVLMEEPTPPSKARPGVPRDLETVCLKCLAKEPARRYGSAEALADDLERWLKGEPVQGRPVGRLERTWLWCRRNPAAAGLSTAFVVALLLGAAVSTYFAVASNANYQDARRREKEANDQKDQVNKAKGELEETLARSLLRPLGQDDSKVTDPEIDALWELSAGSDRVRVLFVAQALRRPGTARQLRNRADVAVHATTGLDPSQRQEVEKTLLTCLLDGQSDFGVRTNCVFIGLELDEWSPEFARAAARQTLAAMTTGNADPRTLPGLAEAFAKLAPQLPPAEVAGYAAEAAGKVEESLKDTNDPYTMLLLADTLGALAPWLDPEETENAADGVLEALGKTFGFPTRGKPAEGALRESGLDDFVAAVVALQSGSGKAAFASRVVEPRFSPHTFSFDQSHAFAQLAQRLSPTGSAAVAGKVLKAMKETNGANSLMVLATALMALVPRMERADAAQLSAEAGRRIVEVMEGSHNPAELEQLVISLADLQPLLEGGESGRLSANAARRILALMDGPDDLQTRGKLAWAASQDPQLDPGAAAVIAHRLLDGMDDKADGLYLVVITGALARLAPRLGPRDAADAARVFLTLMEKPNDRTPWRDLTEAVVSLLPREEPEEAAQQTKDVVRNVVKALGRTHGDNSLQELARCLADLTPWLALAEAADAAREVQEAMGRTDDPETLCALAGTLAGLDSDLSSEEEARHEACGVRRIVEVLVKRSDKRGMEDLAGALANLAPHLGTKDATDDARQVLEAMGGTNDPEAWGGLAEALARLAPRLKAEAAADASGQILETMGKTRAPDSLRSLARALAALAPRLAAGAAPPVARQVLEALTWADDPVILTHLAEVTAVLPPGQESGQAPLSAAARRIVEVLGYTNDPKYLSSLAKAAAVMAPRLETDAAEALARQAVEAMGKTNDSEAQSLLADAVAALMTKLDPEETSVRTSLLACALGNAAQPSIALPGLAPVAEASRPLPERLTEQQLVNLLKLPTCPQPAREFILRRLGDECGQPFADVWEFVDWAREHRPQLDLTSPPGRPAHP